MGSQFLAFLITALGLHWAWGTGRALPSFLAHGVLLNYLFAAQHELNHYTAFKTRWPNDFFNRVTGFLQLYPREYGRWYHFDHHHHTQNWERDPELLSRGGPYTLASYLPYLVGITYWTGRIKRLFWVAAGNTANYCIASEKRKVVVESRAHLGASERPEHYRAHRSYPRNRHDSQHPHHKDLVNIPLARLEHAVPNAARHSA